MILKNPDNGAEIKTEILGQKWIVPVGTTKNYPDEVGLDLKERYGFLEEIDNNEIKVVELADGFACSECDFTSKAKIGVLGHMRSHNKEEIKEVEEATPVGKVTPRLVGQTHEPVGEMDLPNGMDKDGVDWYGEGVQEENRSFEQMRGPGQAHFMGGN